MNDEQYEVKLAGSLAKGVLIACIVTHNWIMRE